MTPDEAVKNDTPPENTVEAVVEASVVEANIVDARNGDGSATPRLTLYVYPSAKLREKALPVGIVTDDTVKIVKAMEDVVAKLSGASLAATQIGVPLRIIVVDGEISGNPTLTAFVNPEITSFATETLSEREGCLSFPGCWVTITRPASCKVKALNLKGEVFEIEAKGVYARAILHEIDHLNGKLLIDHTTSELRRRMIKGKMAKWHKAAVRELAKRRR